MRPSRLLDRAPMFALITAPTLIEVALARRAGLPLAAGPRAGHHWRAAVRVAAGSALGGKIAERRRLRIRVDDQARRSCGLSTWPGCEVLVSTRNVDSMLDPDGRLVATIGSEPAP